jgi:hypothetical protein
LTGEKARLNPEINRPRDSTSFAIDDNLDMRHHMSLMVFTALLFMTLAGSALAASPARGPRPPITPKAPVAKPTPPAPSPPPLVTTPSLKPVEAAAPKPKAPAPPSPASRRHK